jgi:hypothetical protein
VVADAGADDTRTRDRFEVLLAVMAVGVGVVVAWIDSRPSWDDTGITVGLLLLASTGLAFLGGRRPWLWALLVGAPLPAVEIVTEGTLASLIALTFAAVGAAIGWGLRRAIEPARDDRP